MVSQTKMILLGVMGVYMIVGVVCVVMGRNVATEIGETVESLKGGLAEIPDPALMFSNIGIAVIVLGVLGAYVTMAGNDIYQKSWMGANGVLIVVHIYYGMLFNREYDKETGTYSLSNVVTALKTNAGSYGSDSSVASAMDKIHKKYSCCGGSGFLDYITRIIIPRSCCRLFTPLTLDLLCLWFNWHGCAPAVYQSFADKMIQFAAWSYATAVCEIAGMGTCYYMFFVVEGDEEEEEDEEDA